MNQFFVAIALLLSANSFADRRPNYTQLVCKSLDGEVITISGLGTSELKSNFWSTKPFAIPGMTDGDCANRKTYCWQEGQVMMNIPKSLASGRRQFGVIWVNPDTDDIPENNRLGFPYDCAAE